jgi:hypothetical protein
LQGNFASGLVLLTISQPLELIAIFDNAVMHLATAKTVTSGMRRFRVTKNNFIVTTAHQGERGALKVSFFDCWLV